jgi:hypothetical protein
MEQTNTDTPTSTPDEPLENREVEESFDELLEPETKEQFQSDVEGKTDTQPDSDTEKEISLYGRNWTKKIFSYKCSIDEGNRPIKSVCGTSPPNVSIIDCIPNCVNFTGECYLCGTTGHSQNYCPLKKCDSCMQFGHSDKVCPTHRRSPTKNRKADRKSFSYDRKRKYEFGSGWRKQKSSSFVPIPSDMSNEREFSREG